MLSLFDSGDGNRNGAPVSLLQQEHVHQREICRWEFLLQTEHTHPVSAWRIWGKPSVLPSAATHRLPRRYQEHQALLYEHKVSAHTSLTNCCSTVFTSLSVFLLCLNACKHTELEQAVSGMSSVTSFYVPFSYFFFFDVNCASLFM